MQRLLLTVLSGAVLCVVCWFALRDPGAVEPLRTGAMAAEPAAPGESALDPARPVTASPRAAAPAPDAPPEDDLEPAPDVPDARAEPRASQGPDPRIPVVVRTRDGRPFSALAEDRGVSPKNLFVHAFHVAASHAPILEGARRPSAGGDLVRFHPPPEYQQVSLPGSVAGELEVLASPPFWVGLWIHGVLYEARVLQVHDTKLLFEIDAQAVDAGLAMVRMQLVDKDSGAPVLDATGTLKADTSAHRRANLSDVAPDDEGRLVFRGVIPGRHDLAVLREGNIVQRSLELAPGQELDLGQVEIRSGPGLTVRVVDARGAAVEAWIEIAPLKRGALVHDLYPPNLHRTTDRDGVYVLPVPDRTSVVRARPLESDGHSFSSGEVGTLNRLVDPDAVPPELVLVMQEPVDLRVEPLTAWVAGQRITFEDAHGLIVDQAGGERGGKLDADLVPGRYTVRRWDGELELGTLEVHVAAEDATVRAP